MSPLFISHPDSPPRSAEGGIGCGFFSAALLPSQLSLYSRYKLPSPLTNAEPSFHPTLFPLPSISVPLSMGPFPSVSQCGWCLHLKIKLLFCLYFPLSRYTSISLLHFVTKLLAGLYLMPSLLLLPLFLKPIPFGFTENKEIGGPWGPWILWISSRQLPDLNEREKINKQALSYKSPGYWGFLF